MRERYLSYLSRAQLPNGLTLGLGGGCQLGPFQAPRKSKRAFQTSNCGKPMVVQISDVRVCAECLAKIEAIAADAKQEPVAKRRPRVQMYRRLRSAA